MMPRLKDSVWHSWWKRSGEAELRALVMKEWDPIGVAAFEGAATDEYDSYLGPIASRLREGAYVEELAGYLEEVRAEWMGLPPDERHDLATARAISEWYAEASPSA